MSIVIKHEDKSKEYFLDQISSVGSNASVDTSVSSGLYLNNGKIVDEHGNDITSVLDEVLSESVVEGDMIVEYAE